jgi:class 3 adenylate cyclase
VIDSCKAFCVIVAPTGTVTFLFTDIEWSTRLWEERPDEMRAALAEHDAIVRDAIEVHGGKLCTTSSPPAIAKRSESNARQIAFECS